VDDIAFMHSMYAENSIHGSDVDDEFRSHSEWSSVFGILATYGLGSVNGKPAGFVVTARQNWWTHQRAEELVVRLHACGLSGVVMRASGTSIHDLTLPPGMTASSQRKLLDRLKGKNLEHLAARREDNSELSARIASYELAFKMRSSAPEAVELAEGVAP
jgi:hypothetical protein